MALPPFRYAPKTPWTILSGLAIAQFLQHRWLDRIIEETIRGTLLPGPKHGRETLDGFTVAFRIAESGRPLSHLNDDIEKHAKAIRDADANLNHPLPLAHGEKVAAAMKEHGEAIHRVSGEVLTNWFFLPTRKVLESRSKSLFDESSFRETTWLTGDSARCQLHALAAHRSTAMYLKLAAIRRHSRKSV